MVALISLIHVMKAIQLIESLTN